MNKAHFRLIGCQREAMFSCMYYTGQNDYRRGIVATDRGEFTTAQSESLTIGRACPYTEGGTAPGDALPLLVHHFTLPYKAMEILFAVGGSTQRQLYM